MILLEALLPVMTFVLLIFYSVLLFSSSVKISVVHFVVYLFNKSVMFEIAHELRFPVLGYLLTG